ncbi:MAG: acetate/propionate family kinase [Rhodospirillales bacterium]|nr:acetate/propionate family kinase [Rhodospirillales bacterium]
MTETILVVNAGSSSLKFELFRVGSQDSLARAIKGRVDGIPNRPHLSIRDASGVVVDEHLAAGSVPDLPAALALARGRVVEWLDGAAPVAIGHRVVHGGPDYSAPVLVDDIVLAKLQRYVPLAPLHQPNNLAPIRAVWAHDPALPQVACFDTAFHRGRSELADRFALPERLYEEGVRRYGFHGLSYEYIAGRMAEIAPELADRRLIVAHLGSGASLCAMRERRSVESSMGFTALDGIPMGTRPGQLDPGVVLYLIAEKGLDVGEVQRLLYQECGLKGLSGISNDVRELLASSDPRASRAIEIFVYRTALMAGALTAALGGLDAFVFTAGIGENAPEVRTRIGRYLAWFGLELDPAANDANATRISRPSSPVGCFVVPTDEELMIGRHTLEVLRRQPAHARG